MTLSWMSLSRMTLCIWMLLVHSMVAGMHLNLSWVSLRLYCRLGLHLRMIFQVCLGMDLLLLVSSVHHSHLMLLRNKLRLSLGLSHDLFCNLRLRLRLLLRLRAQLGSLCCSSACILDIQLATTSSLWLCCCRVTFLLRC